MSAFRYILRAALCVLLTSCAIEPPLRLADIAQPVEMTMPIVITDMETVWDADADWRKGWYYGWDETDEKLWGSLDYPTPTNFEVRRFFVGQEPSRDYVSYDRFTVYGNRFRRKFSFGYHNMLFWSNIDSPDHTQSVIINESNLSDIFATTSRSRVGYSSSAMRTRAAETRNQPDIFYASQYYDLQITQNPEDYDYFDEEDQCWVKLLRTELVPVVYIYLVQAILHNNNERLVGVSDQTVVTGLADGVSLHTGVSSGSDANITFDMRMKNGIVVEGEVCDVAGGKLTTFGLCEMQPWSKSARSRAATRQDIDNSISFCFLHRKGKEIIVSKDITSELREHPHGGVITIHIDVEDLGIDDRPANSGFSPTATDYGKEEHEFTI